MNVTGGGTMKHKHLVGKKMTFADFLLHDIVDVFGYQHFKGTFLIG
jgi:hypothetical protein